MKLLLCRNVEKLGIVGDIVDVAAGYGRNYLLPHGLATEPTEANVRALAEARRVAEEERIRHRELLERLAQRLEGVEVTIRARANEEGVLYGSVGRRDVASALVDEGYPIEPDQVALSTPIRHLDNVTVELRLADGIRSEVKVWVVREKSSDEEGEAEASEMEESAVGMEAGSDDHSHDE